MFLLEALVRKVWLSAPIGEEAGTDHLCQELLNLWLGEHIGLHPAAVGASEASEVNEDELMQAAGFGESWFKAFIPRQ